MKMKMTNSSEVFLRYNRKLYSFESGKEVSVHEARKGTVIEFSTAKTFRESDRKISARYVYRKKNGTYVASASLTTAFLHEVLKDVYGENVVIEGKKLLVAFLGEKQEVIFAENEEEKEEVLQHFYQGIDFTRVDVKKAVSLVLKKDYRFVALAFTFTVLAFLFLILFSGEEENYIPELPPAVVKEPKNPELQAVSQTNGFIREVLTLHKHLNVASFVADVDFTNRAVRLYSFIPSEGFSKGNPYFEKAQVLSFEEREPFKDLGNCRKVLYEFRAEPYFITENFEEYLLSAELDIEKAFSFLKDIYGCPAEIHGTIEFVNLFKRKLNLRIKLLRRL